jgi:hypothetical protein
MATLGTFTAGQVLTAAELNAIGTYQAYTPTITGVTIGNGTRVFRYTQINKFIHMYGRFTLGSTSAVSGVIAISLPVTAVANYPSATVATIQDTGTATIPAYSLTTTTVVQVYAVNVAGTYPAIVAPSATVPMTWANTDFVEVSIVYEAA